VRAGAGGISDYAGQFGSTVNSIAPGAFATERTLHAEAAQRMTFRKAHSHRCEYRAGAARDN
jgi:NAD(P)-dependent dehydrogenase (short-subunit alcohol dehydrogenase family)